MRRETALSSALKLTQLLCVVIADAQVLAVDLEDNASIHETAHLLRLAAGRQMSTAMQREGTGDEDQVTQYLTNIMQMDSPVNELAIISYTCQILNINLQLWSTGQKKPVHFRLRQKPVYISMALVASPRGPVFMPVRRILKSPSAAVGDGAGPSSGPAPEAPTRKRKGKHVGIL
jgi:hypothetical protein